MCTVTSGALVAAVAACARPGNTPEGHTGVSTVTMTAEAPAASIARPDISSFLTRMPAKDGTVPCAQDPVIARRPSGEIPPPNRGAGPDDAQPKAGIRPDGAQPGAGAGPDGAQPNRDDTRPKSGATITTNGPSDDADERTRRTLEQQQTPLPRRGDVPEAAARGAESCARNLSLELNLLLHSGIGVTPATITRSLTNTGLLQPVVEGDRFAASTGKACVVGRIVDGKAELSIAPLPCKP
jgi:hypothetical protein